MRVITAQALEEHPGTYKEIAQVLTEEGLVCFPTRRQYVVAASLFSEEAVLRLVQSKRRSTKAPALVFIPERKGMHRIVADIHPKARVLMNAFWPGPLTLMFEPNQEELPARVLKTLLDKKRTKLAVRIGNGVHTVNILQAFGGPLLISSANIAQKVGASSVAQIKKNFAHTVDLLVDGGDVAPDKPSTIIDIVDGRVIVQREGVVATSEVERVLREAEEAEAAALAAKAMAVSGKR